MTRTCLKAILCNAVACAFTLVYCGAVWAQQDSTGTATASVQKPGELEEILVTARKRVESILNVPVIETAIPQVQLERMQVVEMSDLPNLVPGLDFGKGNLTIGTQVSIRGVGTTSYDQGVDPSVALNIDGMSPGNGLAFESGMFDLAQVEVLKGPQALFFGKSTPGGVISLRTADPTDEFEVLARTAYDFEARTAREEAIISGPVTDTIKLRLASMYSTSDGYFYNTAVAVPGLGGTTPTDAREPAAESYNVRGTALWNPADNFDVRLKLNLVHDRTTNLESDELVSCPEGPGFAPAGIPFIGPNDNCQLSRDIRVVYMNPTDYPGIINNGVPYVDTQQEFGIVELNYRPRSDLTITSVTANYQIISDSLVNALETTGAGTPLAAENFFHRHEATEELRASSDFASPLNFTAGGFYENGLMTENVILPGNTALGLPGVLGGDYDPVTIKTYSLFGQLRWAIVPKLELAGGLRWSDETRTEAPVDLSGNPIAVTNPRVHSNNIAPEVTLTFRPTDDLTMFAALKKAYKSGSFSLATPATAGTNNSFGEEKAEGGEVGMKSRLLDRRLSLNAAAYLYTFTGLQSGAIEPASNGEINVQTVNAGSARTYGLDFDAAYNPVQVDGLTLNGALNWNHARYLEFNNAPCWGGQTIAQGCNQILNPATGLYSAQNLSGTPLIRAPAWALHLGFEYSYPIGDYKMLLTNNNSFSSRYVTFLAVGRPDDDNYQGSFFKSDLGLTLQSPDDTWEVALIGKDINNKITTGNCAPANYAGGGLFGTQLTGGAVSGPAGIDQVGCYVDPGREVWLRLTVKAFGAH